MCATLPCDHVSGSWGLLLSQVSQARGRNTPQMDTENRIMHMYLDCANPRTTIHSFIHSFIHGIDATGEAPVIVHTPECLANQPQSTCRSVGPNRVSIMIQTAFALWELINSDNTTGINDWFVLFEGGRWAPAEIFLPCCWEFGNYDCRWDPRPALLRDRTRSGEKRWHQESSLESI